jgi:GGDEF domain-containing protein
MLVNDQVVHVTASVGIVCFPKHGGLAETILLMEDKAMYQAKE